LNLCSLLFDTTDNYNDNLLTLLTLVKQTKENSLIVAPEVCLTAYDYDNFKEVLDFAPHAIEEIKKVSQNKIIILTILERRDGEVFNFAKIFYNGEVVYERAKARLFRFGDEHKYLKAGKKNKIIPFEVDGIRFGILICFELRFKELWKALEGVDIIVIPARWGIMRKEHLEILSKALAIINQCFVLVANSKDEDMASSSAIISPSGESIFDDNSEVIVGNIDFKEIKKMRRYIVMD